MNFQVIWKNIECPLWKIVNLPYDNFIDLEPCFLDSYSLVRGMVLDCDVRDITEKTKIKRTTLLVGDINCASGFCGCCQEKIVYVYRVSYLNLESFV